MLKLRNIFFPLITLFLSHLSFFSILPLSLSPSLPILISLSFHLSPLLSFTFFFIFLLPASISLHSPLTLFLSLFYSLSLSACLSLSLTPSSHFSLFFSSLFTYSFCLFNLPLPSIWLRAPAWSSLTASTSINCLYWLGFLVRSFRRATLGQINKLCDEPWPARLYVRERE